MKKLLCLLTVGCALTLSACNTVEGIGEDTKAGGQALKETAQENKGY